MITLLYIFLFISLYIMIFWLITFMRCGDHKKVKCPYAECPAVTIIVPCFNEEKTVARTLDSILALDYPMDLVTVLAVNDGSTDKTPQVLGQYAKQYKNITVLHKENDGSKFTALNYALDFTKTDLVGCLDSDSFVSPESLRYIVAEFRDKEVMSVIPTMVIHEPRSILQYAQRVEYEIAAITRKIFHLLDAIYITPGPFSFFRMEVFNKIGKYRHAYYVEDCEVALRMQVAGMKIVHAENAIVATQGPDTIMKLQKQRVRWTRGFIGNVWDYRQILLNRKYGEVGFSVVPSGFIRLFLSTMLIPTIFWSFLFSVYLFIEKFIFAGASISFSYSNIIYQTEALTLFLICTFIIMIIFIYYGRRIIARNEMFTFDIPAMVLIYNFISPFWAIESWYRVISRRENTWR